MGQVISKRLAGAPQQQMLASRAWMNCFENSFKSISAPINISATIFLYCMAGVSDYCVIIALDNLLQWYWCFYHPLDSQYATSKQSISSFINLLFMDKLWHNNMLQKSLYDPWHVLSFKHYKELVISATLLHQFSCRNIFCPCEIWSIHKHWYNPNKQW